MGLAASKLKKKKSNSNLTWSRRIGSLASLRKFRQSHVIVEEEKKHLDMKKWLRTLDLEQYEDNFDKYDGVEELLDFSEIDIKNLGVKISSHRALIMSSLTVLKAKYNGPIKRNPRHSVAVDSRNKLLKENDSLADLKVVADSLQSKSLNNLRMEPCMDPHADAAALKKALEWELSLDSRDIRSHAWYHGAIPRSRAEEIVREEGGFLVRDCTSQPGNYVLSCRTKIQPLHFVINKMILQENTVYERVQYQFEDEAFDTVADLITSYVGSGKPITQASGAKIQFPKNRMYPLSFYATKYPTPLCPSRLTSPATTPITNSQLRCNPLQVYKQSASPTRISRETPPRLPSRKQRSQSLTPSEVNRIAQEKANSADGVIQSPLMTRSAGSELTGLKFSTQSLPRSTCTKISLSPSSLTLGRNPKIVRGTSETSLSPCTERRCFQGDEEHCESPPPPKPSRLPRTESRDSDMLDGKFDGTFLSHGSLQSLQRITSYHASGSDSGNGSGDSALSSAAGDTVDTPHRNLGVIIKNPRYNIVNSESSTTLKNFDIDYKEIEERIIQMPLMPLDLSSRFDLENCQTLLLPLSENKPLDSQALKGIKIILKESGSRILANHLTKNDLDLIFAFDGHRDKSKLNMKNGLELCTLPHGHQFRLDLIERTECLKLLVAVTILTCADEAERAETLNKWIEVAIDTKTALGNLYGFCGVMLGLCLPQVQRLHSTWHMLRQRYTDAAFNFEAKLRPTLKNMNNCSNPQAPNTTIPHLLPFVLLIERNLDGFLKINESSNNQTSSSSSSLASSCLDSWETNKQDFGLSTLLAHLDTARKFTNLFNTYQRNAVIVLDEARMEELTLDLFKTEFHLKFLWGSRGAFADTNDRHAKFEQVLNVMTDKYCCVQQADSEV